MSFLVFFQTLFLKLPIEFFSFTSESTAFLMYIFLLARYLSRFCSSFWHLWSKFSCTSFSFRFDSLLEMFFFYIQLNSFRWKLNRHILFRCWLIWISYPRLSFTLWRRLSEQSFSCIWCFFVTFPNSFSSKLNLSSSHVRLNRKQIMCRLIEVEHCSRFCFFEKVINCYKCIWHFFCRFSKCFFHKVITQFLLSKV